MVVRLVDEERGTSNEFRNQQKQFKLSWQFFFRGKMQRKTKDEKYNQLTKSIFKGYCQTQEHTLPRLEYLLALQSLYDPFIHIEDGYRHI